MSVFTSRGFALPTVMMASVVMMMVLVSGLAATSSVNTALRVQYKQKQLSSVAQAGLEMANACLAANNNEMTWSESQPLRPNTNCYGEELVSCPSTSTDASCYMAMTNDVRSTFSVGGVANSDTQVIVEAISQNLRKTDGGVSSEERLQVQGGPANKTVAGVSASGSYTCAVSADLKPYCWGYNGYGGLGNGTAGTATSPSPTAVLQGAIPSGVTIRSIVATFTHSCALGSNGSAYCWGTNSFGQLGNNSTAAVYTPVAVAQGAIPAGVSLRTIDGGYYHTCAIGSDRKVYCWGDNSQGQLGNGGVGATSAVPVAVSQGAMPAGVYAKSLSSAYNHTCATASDGKVYCWGRNTEGQIGNGGTTNALTPVQVNAGAMGIVGATAVAAAYNHTCALGADGSSYCWGQNSANQLGNGTATNSLVPVKTSAGAVPAGVKFQMISTEYQHTCAAASNGSVYCWGQNAYGQFGNNTTTGSSTPVAAVAGAFPAGESITGISVGDYHTCVNASNAKLYCWGYNVYGGLGTGNTSQSNVPAEVTGSNTAYGYGMKSAIETGQTYACAIGTDQRPYCWGQNNSYQLGNGTTTNSTIPTPVALGARSSATVTRLSVGIYSACVTGSDLKNIYCWGSNSNGILGNGSTTNASTPTTVSQGAMPNDVTIRSISVGDDSACAVASNNKVYCWGYNYAGQLGDGTTNTSWVPVAVSQGAIPTGVVIRGVSVGASSACAIGSNGKAYCWGLNGSGQLGRAGANSSVPVEVSQGAVPAGVTLRSVSVGTGDACAVASNNSAYCWGWNLYGQLGNGTTTNSSTPVAVAKGVIPAAVNIRSLSLGPTNTCAIGTDDKAYCWGYNANGQLGNGNTTNSGLPVAVSQGAIPAGVTIRSISSGHSFACAISSASMVYCWGQNSSGQIGNGTTATTVAAPTQTTQSLRWRPYAPIDTLIVRY